MAELVRVNTRISVTVNAWLEEQTRLTGLAKSTQIMLALENYHQQKEMLARMGDMGEIMNKLDQMESRDMSAILDTLQELSKKIDSK